jgi:hypothetical protein
VRAFTAEGFHAEAGFEVFGVELHLPAAPLEGGDLGGALFAQVEEGGDDVKFVGAVARLLVADFHQAA